MISRARDSQTIGLMLSGGVDSAILLGHLLGEGHRVQPFYVSTGCLWEPAERTAVESLVAAIDHAAVEPVVQLTMPVADLYGEHWSLTGEAVPDATTEDEAVHLPARNPLLLLKPMLWCGQHGIEKLALATLSCNPFADASATFLRQLETALVTATGNSVNVVRPFVSKTKQQLLALAADLPLQLTFSCLSPQSGRHCGACNKCAERLRVLQSLPGGDPTEYVGLAPSLDF